MSGIIGYLGQEPAAEVILDALSHLEYRGYDRAGVAVLGQDFAEREQKGRLRQLLRDVLQNPLEGHAGVGYTDWSVADRPQTLVHNFYADTSGRLRLVFHGIVANYWELRAEREAAGDRFSSDDDGELLVYLIASALQGDLAVAVRQILRRVEGVYALCLLDRERPEQMIAARHGSPLMIGVTSDGFFVASDLPAILNFTRQVAFLGDDSVASLSRKELKVTDLNGVEKELSIRTLDWNLVAAEKGGYDHFMLKEIHEQPQALTQAIASRLPGSDGMIHLAQANISPEVARKIERVIIVACGTSYHAGLLGELYLETLAGLPTEVKIASEYLYHRNLTDEKTLVISISQSGETKDTAGAFQEAKSAGAHTLAIVNARQSTLAELADGWLYLRVGSEIGVASTKAYTATLAILYLLALKLGADRGKLTPEQVRSQADGLRRVPQQVREILRSTKDVQDLAESLMNYKNCFFLGRGYNYPTALEGGLKLKEVSYLHTEAMPEGEVRHGPVAIVDANMPVITIATPGLAGDRIGGTLDETRSRNAPTVAILTPESELSGDYVLRVPSTAEPYSPLLNIIPLQLLAYYVAAKKGSDVDKPRHLTKAVLVD